MKILIGACTKLDESKFSDTPIYKSLLQYCKAEKASTHILFTGIYDAIIKTENNEPITKHYNKVLKMGIDEQYDCVILMHDDVAVQDSDLVDKLSEGFEKYDVLGLAGAQEIELKEPALWHLMSKQEHWSGAVAHPHPGGGVFVTSFGPTPRRCLVLDGLFLAIKVSSLTDQIKFDEDIPAIAHYYDLDYLLTCNKHGLKSSTWPIWVVHSSGGLDTPDEQFYAAQKYFLKKWIS